MVHCVTSHIDLTVTGADVHPNTNLKKNEYTQMMEWMFSSCALFLPDSLKIVLTDKNTVFPEFSEKFKILRFPMQKDTLMYDRMVAQARYLNEFAPENANICFLDTDILISKSFDALFKLDFDIGLTYRNNEEMPINGGFILVKNSNNAKQFFSKCLQIYKNLEEDQKKWWGDQISIAKFLGEQKDALKDRIVDVQGVKILFLNCKHFNFTPKQKSEIELELKDKYVLHFKGDKKILMAPYWFMYLNKKYSKSLIAKILAYFAANKSRKSLK